MRESNLWTCSMGVGHLKYRPGWVTSRTGLPNRVTKPDSVSRTWKVTRYTTITMEDDGNQYRNRYVLHCPLLSCTPAMSLKRFVGSLSCRSMMMTSRSFGSPATTYLRMPRRASSSTDRSLLALVDLRRRPVGLNLSGEPLARGLGQGRLAEPVALGLAENPEDFAPGLVQQRRVELLAQTLDLVRDPFSLGLLVLGGEFRQPVGREAPSRPAC